MHGLKTGIKIFMNNFAKEIQSSFETSFFVILGIYQLSLFLEYVQFAPFHGFFGGTLKMWLSIVLLALLGIYLGSILALSVQTKWAIYPVLILMTAFLYICARMQRNKLDGLLIAILAVCAYGKDYNKILKVMLGCAVVTVFIAMIGLPIGYTVEKPKVGLYGTGLALGFAHPNIWGSYIFFIFVLVWYLFVRKKRRNIRFGYLIFSWILALFMVSVPKCRTQALLLLLFPPTIWLCKKMIITPSIGKEPIWHKAVLCFLILFPVICFFATIFLGSQREWLAVHTMGTYIENFSKRFIQGGLAFREHGFPLFGELIRFHSGLVEHLGDYNFSLYILDNAYVTYTIYRGMIWMAPALLWLCYANREIIEKKDYSLLTISTLFCLMGLMEIYTLEVYNFIFLYPLSISMMPDEPTIENKEKAFSL